MTRTPMEMSAYRMARRYWARVHAAKVWIGIDWGKPGEDRTVWGGV